MVKVAGAFKTVPVAIVGVVDEKIDSKVMMHKIEKAPPETFDVGFAHFRLPIGIFIF